MDITEEKIDALNSLVKIKLQPEDYEESVNKKLNEYRKKAKIPGFRPGKVPMGVVKKMAGKGTLIEEVNKILSDSIYKYIVDNKLDILGNPLPKEDETVIDWENQKDFEFTYELGLSPQFEVDQLNKLKMDRYTVKIDDKLTNQYISDVAKQYGKMSNPEKVENDDDLLYGKFEELDGTGAIKEGGISNNSTLIIKSITDSKLKKSLMGAKAGATFQVKVSQFDKNVDLGRIFGISQEEAQALISVFNFTVEKVNRLEAADLNTELFDKLYGPGVIKTEEEFRAKVTEEISKRFEVSTDQKLHVDVQTKLIEKLKISLPDAFLKRWLLAANENPVTKEQIEAEYEQYTRGLKWQLIENKLIQKYELKVTEEELTNHIKVLLREQFASMGQGDVEDAMLDDTVKRVLENQEEVRKLNDQLYSQKLLTLFKEHVKVKEKQVSYDEFSKLAQG